MAIFQNVTVKQGWGKVFIKGASATLEDDAAKMTVIGGRSEAPLTVGDRYLVTDD